MLKKRLIFSLIYDQGSFMLSRNFKLQRVGDLSWIRENYDFNAIAKSIDELVVLNVSRNEKNINEFQEALIELSKNCFIPLTAGGGIRNINDAYKILNSGADKLILNSQFFFNKNLVETISKTFGNQCIVCSIDYKVLNNNIEIYTSNGKIRINLTLKEVVQNAYKLGAGEIYLTSIDKDGTGQGLDLENIELISSYTNLPIIASGGIGKPEHMKEGLQITKVDAVSTANLFYFMEDGLIESREYLRTNGINLALWN